MCAPGRTFLPGAVHLFEFQWQCCISRNRTLLAPRYIKYASAHLLHPCELRTNAVSRIQHDVPAHRTTCCAFSLARNFRNVREYAERSAHRWCISDDSDDAHTQQRHCVAHPKLAGTTMTTTMTPHCCVIREYYNAMSDVNTRARCSGFSPASDPDGHY